MTRTAIHPFTRNGSRFEVLRWGVVPLGVLMVIWNSGIWPMPNLSAQYLVSKSLRHNPFSDPMAQYIYTNYFEPLLFRLMGGSDLGGYLIFCLAVSVIFIVSFCIWFVSFHGRDVALRDGKLLVALTFPVFIIPFYWIGMDGMTLLLMLLIFVGFERKISFIPAIILGVQHFEQGVAGLLILFGSLVILYFYRRDGGAILDIKRIVLLIGFVVVGKLLQAAWFQANGVSLIGGRAEFMAADAVNFFRGWKVHWQAIGWALFGSAWIFVIPRIKNLWPLLVGALVSFLFMSVVGDQTRVAVIILFPSVFYFIFRDREMMQEITRLGSCVYVISYLIIPVTVVWGSVHHNLRSNDLAVYRDWRDGNFKLSEFNWLAPFVPSGNARNIGLNDWVFPAVSLPTRVGSIEHGMLISKAGSSSGFLSFGPYANLPAGKYRATVRYVADGGSAERVGWVDVTERSGSVELMKTVLMGSNGVRSYTDIDFEIPRATDGVEVRVWTDGRNEIQLSSLEIRGLQKK